MNDSAIPTLFPIRRLSAETQVKTVTLRAWERRYGLLKPVRTAKGHRLYHESDIVRVKEILAWINRGVAVSKIKPLLEKEALPQEEIDQETWLPWQQQLAEASKQFNEEKVLALFSQLHLQYTAPVCVRYWLQPVFEQLERNPQNAAELCFLASCLAPKLQQQISNHNKEHKHNITLLMASSRSPHWRLLLTGLWLSQYDTHIHLILQAPSIECWPKLISKLGAHSVLYYHEQSVPQQLSTILGLKLACSQQYLIGPEIWLALQNQSVDNWLVTSQPLDAAQALSNRFN